jgi:hypothetical protein
MLESLDDLMSSIMRLAHPDFMKRRLQRLRAVRLMPETVLLHGGGTAIVPRRGQHRDQRCHPEGVTHCRLLFKKQRDFGALRVSMTVASSIILPLRTSTAYQDGWRHYYLLARGLSHNIMKTSGGDTLGHVMCVNLTETTPLSIRST